MSAAHVINKTLTAPILIRTTKQFVRLVGPVATSDETPYDVGCLYLPDGSYPQLPYSEFLSISAVVADPDETASDGELYTVLGFPVKLSSRDDTGTHLSIRPITYTAPGRPKELKALRLSPDTHVALEFERLKSFNADGLRETVPGPEGLSGGPIFKIDRSGEGNHRLVGVVTRWPNAARNVLVGGHINVCLGAIQQIRPDLLTSLYS